MKQIYLKRKSTIQHFLFLVLAFGLLANSAWSQSLVSSKIDAKSIAIGDQFHLFLEAKVPSDKGILTWASIPALQNLEVVDTGSVDSLTENGLTIYRQTLTLTSFEEGQVIVPAFKFSLNAPDGELKALFSDSFVVDVKTIAVDTAAPMKPIKDIILVKPSKWENWPWIVAGIVGLGLLIWLIWFLIKKLKSSVNKRKERTAETPDQKALRLLTLLGKQSFDGEDGQKEYYTQLTQVIRDYLESRFHVSVAEMTTDELLKLSKESPELRKVRTELKSIFRTADLAKFAKAKPGPEAQEICLKEAKSLVRRTTQEQAEGSTT